VTDPPAPRQPPDVTAAVAERRVPGRPTLPEVYESHFSYVWTCLRRLGVWDRDLEDATHDVFVVVHRRMDDFDATRPIKPWLAGISARVASEFHRRARNRYEIASDDVEAIATTPAADDVMRDRQRRALVLQALERLDFDRRTVFVLHDIEGHAMPEIASSLETSVNTLYSRLRAARAEFAAAVKALAQGQGT
jgi:RNA polymerase sigma-70 factor, ECF subfamily